MSLPPPPPPPPIPPNPAGMEANIDHSYPPYEEPQSEGLAVVMNVITTITHWLLGAISIGAFVYANQSGGQDHLKQHIYLNVTGYVILMTQAILSFNPNAGWTNNLMYPTKKVMHWMLQITGSSLAIAGSFIRISRVRWRFETAHGILGLIALCFTILSLVAGLMHLICQKKLNTLLHRTIHSCLGILTLSVAFITLCYGFNHDDFRGDLGDENADLCIAFTIIALIGTLISAFGTMFKRICGSLNFDN